MFRNKKPDVLIAGAGPVGLFTGLSLAQRDVQVMIVDAEPRSTTHSYALALHPASLRLLDSVGLLEAVLERAFLVRSIGLYDKAERRAEIDLGGAAAEPRSCIAVLRQSALEELLESALKDLGVKVGWSQRLARFEQRSEMVAATVDKLVKDSVGYAVSRTEWLVGRSIDLEVPFVIGADGHASLVRRQLEIDFEEVAPAQVFAVFEFATDRERPHEMRLVFDETTTSVLWPLPERRCRWSFELEGARVPEEARVKDRLLFDLGSSRYPALNEDFLGELLRQRAPWFEDSIEDIEWRMAVRFEQRRASSFGSGRLWLAGDAGHMAGPAGIQSMNVGLREAKQLADTMFDVLEKGASLDGLEHYGRERLEEWRFLQGSSGGLESKKETDPWVASRASRLLGCLPASGEDLEKMVGQLGLEARV